MAHLALSLDNAGYASLLDDARRDPQAIEQAALQVWPLPEAAKRDLGVHLREALSERP